MAPEKVSNQYLLKCVSEGRDGKGEEKNFFKRGGRIKLMW